MVDEFAVRYVVTALVVVEFPTIKLVKLAKVARREEKNPLVEVELVILALVPYMLVAVMPVAEAVVSDVCPLTTNVPEDERLVVDALPREEEAEVMLVNDGLGDTAMVEVEEKMILDPAIK